MGKNKWPPIEHGMIEWHSGMAQNDPAGDLANVTLTLPTPPPSMWTRQQKHFQQNHTGREIKPLPFHAPSRITPDFTRSINVHLASPNGFVTPPKQESFVYSQQEPTPMYGEHDVPMTVQLPMSGHDNTQGSPGIFAPTTAPPWDTLDEMRGIKRSRSYSSTLEDEDEAEKSGGEDPIFKRQNKTLWQD